jgi:uncharacterized protein YjfI (DUF2170 family)
MREYEISVSNITLFVEAESESDAITNAEQLLMETVWDYGHIEVA